MKNRPEANAFHPYLLAAASAIMFRGPDRLAKYMRGSSNLDQDLGRVADLARAMERASNLMDDATGEWTHYKRVMEGVAICDAPMVDAVLDSFEERGGYAEQKAAGDLPGRPEVWEAVEHSLRL